MIIRKAILDDVRGIHSLIKRYSNRGLMLYRHPAQIEMRIRDYFVYKEDGKVYGCAGLRVWDKKSAEIYGLAVAEEKIGHGIGTKLIKKCVSDAKKLKILFIFTLTYRVSLFKKLGFEKINKGSLPRVIFTEKTVDIDKAYGMYI